MFGWLRRLFGRDEASGISLVARDSSTSSRVQLSTREHRAATVPSSIQDYRRIIDEGRRLPAVASLSSGEPVLWRHDRVWIERHGADGEGRLDLTDKGIFFEASTFQVAVQWPRVSTIERTAASVYIHRSDRSTAYELRHPTETDAETMQLVALHLWRRPPEKVAASASAEPYIQPRVMRRAVGTVRVRDLDISDDQHTDLGTGAGYTMGIAGESYRQTALRKLSNGRRERGEDVFFVAVLVHEPENQYDRNAIRVDIQGGDQVGYLPREDAEAYHRVFAAVKQAGKVAVCRAKLIGGTPGKPSIGVVLDLDAPESILERVGGQPF
jgi:hypothetical protein